MAAPASLQNASGSSIERWNAVCHAPLARVRSEEHTSELQSHSDLVCRLLLEKKKKRKHVIILLQHYMRLMIESVDRKRGAAGMPRAVSYAGSLWRERNWLQPSLMSPVATAD